MNELKKLLSSIYINHIEEINIKSNKLQISVNTKKQIHTITNLKKSKKTVNSSITGISIKKQQNAQTQIIKINESETYSTIVSPMVGTFYRSPAPNEPAFIEQHTLVKKKQTVCIIEAMKLMNEIEAELDGEIIEILTKDGDIVDCGQALMKIKPI